MKVVDVICEILKREGVEFLSCYPTNTLIEAAASAGIKPIVCRQERVGVGIADGFHAQFGHRLGYCFGVGQACFMLDFEDHGFAQSRE